MRDFPKKPVKLVVPTNCMEMMRQGVKDQLVVSREVRGQTPTTKGKKSTWRMSDAGKISLLGKSSESSGPEIPNSKRLWTDLWPTRRTVNTARTQIKVDFSTRGISMGLRERTFTPGSILFFDSAHTTSNSIITPNWAVVPTRPGSHRARNQVVTERNLIFPVRNTMQPTPVLRTKNWTPNLIESLESARCLGNLDPDLSRQMETYISREPALQKPERFWVKSIAIWIVLRLDMVILSPMKNSYFWAGVALDGDK